VPAEAAKSRRPLAPTARGARAITLAAPGADANTSPSSLTTVQHSLVLDGSNLGRHTGLRQPDLSER